MYIYTCKLVRKALNLGSNLSTPPVSSLTFANKCNFFTILLGKHGFCNNNNSFVIMIIVLSFFIVSALFRAFVLSFQKRNKLCKRIMVKLLKMWIIGNWNLIIERNYDPILYLTCLDLFRKMLFWHLSIPGTAHRIWRC